MTGFCACGMAVGLEGFHVLAEDVADEEVGESAGADAEVSLLDVILAEGFAHDGVEVDGVGHRFNCARGAQKPEHTDF